MHRQSMLTELLLDVSFKSWVVSDGEEYSQYWEQWQVEHPEDIELLEEAREMLLEWQRDKVSLPDARKEALRRRILSIAQSDHMSADQPGHSVLEKSMVGRWSAIAAVVALLLVGSLLLYSRQGPRTEEMQYATTYGEITTITLPDSSQVTLNGNSSIRYRYQETQQREVWLKGEAFFDVSQQKIPDKEGHLQAVRFIVHTENLSVQVLGTRFNVRHRRDQTQVVLEEGSVQLELKEQQNSVRMSPDEMVEVHKGEKQINQQLVKAGDYSAWKKGLIHFEGASFPEINQILEDNYDLTLHFESEQQAAAINLKGAFPASDINILLEAIANVTHTTLSKKGKTVIYQ